MPRGPGRLKSESGAALKPFRAPHRAQLKPREIAASVSAFLSVSLFRVTSANSDSGELKRRSVRNFFASVKFAIDGFFAALKHEPSFREDIIFVVLLVPLAIILPVNAVSTAVMISSLFLIIVVELINSAIEWTIDYLRPEIHPLAKRVKDMASAAVFMAYVNCIFVWVVLLWPSNGVWDRVEEWMLQ